ncbi:trypsin-like cysteine/serine peptidase domain-containing protein [Polychytrium aggregatum]|uniref:trypsin-like cysteine/serine peptidase domain-containing protein n=1 Tax=Polychytrium aggregatum TaxID=110093 RepID=UPI0022FF1A82|nr:trypsin-like cysteine/serine peptidase domain-containing protein [Polychytrium aggregatum]KAI9205357.1 trypsin-like cysteine/serine peptidase domain-containing protein [Polychytrium aggregatum]
MGTVLLIQPLYCSWNPLADILEPILDSVVRITVEIETNSLIFGKRAFVSAGSGFIIDDKGTILTNAHVVGDMAEDSKLLITTNSGLQFDGYVYSSDELSDLAIVKVNPSEAQAYHLREHRHIWRPVTFAPPEKRHRVGDIVLSVGSPFGLYNTVTAGIISSRARKYKEIGGRDSMVEFIQTDCVLHSGSSGGPLINTDGEVIGINTTRAESDGISFAIRVDKALGMIDQLLTHGRIIRPWLGLKMVSLTESVWQQLLSQQFEGDVADLPPSKRGILIASVFEGSPGDSAGCRAGDVIVAANHEPITSTSQLLGLIGSRIGIPYELTIWRNRVHKTPDSGKQTKSLTHGQTHDELKVSITPEELDVHSSTEHLNFLHT